MSAPHIMSQITSNGQISGGFTQKEVNNLVNILQSGSLPATLKPQPVSESMVGPTLGLDTIIKGVTAIVGAFAVVLVFMLFYYRFAGLVASVALLANLLLTIGFMIGVQATFTLPGLAGLVLMLGMAVDANVLIYERLREERERGASLALAIRNGYDRALPIIIDTHFTGIFTAVVLYVVGNDQLQGFGVSLTVGLIISLFTSLYMTRADVRFLAAQATGCTSSACSSCSPGRTSTSWASAISCSRPRSSCRCWASRLFICRGTQRAQHRLHRRHRFRRQADHGQVDDRSCATWSMRTSRRNCCPASRSRRSRPGGNASSCNILTTTTRARLPSSTRPTDRSARAVAKTGPANCPIRRSNRSFPASTRQRQGLSRSKYFIIRTTEKEPELVQAVLDRLLIARKWTASATAHATHLREGGIGGQEQLLNAACTSTMPTAQRLRRTADLKQAGRSANAHAGLAELRQDADRPRSQAGVQRHRRKNRRDFDIIGEGQTRRGPLQSSMNFSIKDDVAKPERDQKAKVFKALRGRRRFRGRPQPDVLETFDSQPGHGNAVPGHGGHHRELGRDSASTCGSASAAGRSAWPRSSA